MDPRADRTALRLKLYENGFEPLANKHKACFLIGWNKLEVTPELIEEWGRKRAYMDTGIRCGDVVAVDLDIDDADLLADLADAINESGITTESPFVRIGRAPREMWIYRTMEPLGKRTTGAFTASSDPDAPHVQLEILGKGNQFGAYGEHHEGVLYTWPEQDLCDHTYMDLPILTREQAEQLVAFTAEFFEARGLLRRTLGGANDGRYTHAYDLTAEMTFTVRDMGLLTVAELESYLRDNPDETLRVTVETLRPSTKGSFAGMASLTGGTLCISDHGDQISHFPEELEGGESMRKLGALLLEKFPQLFDETMPSPPTDQTDGPHDAESYRLEPHASFDDNLVVALKRFVYVTSDGKIRDLAAPGDKYTLADLKAHLSPYYQAQRSLRGGREQIAYLADAWVKHPKRMAARVAVMRPDRPAPFFEEDGERHFNIWRPRVLPTHGNPLPGFGLLERLLPDAGERAWFTQWLAYKIAHPEARGPGVVMVAHDTFGTGRGSLIELLSDIFGDAYVRTVSFATLTGKNYQSQYNQWMSDSLIVAVNEAEETAGEARWKARYTAYEHLKTIIDPGGHKMEVLRKGVDNYQGRTFASVFVATNHGDAMVIPQNDRRLAVLENGSTQDPSYWKVFHAWRNDLANVGAFRDALLKTDVETYNPFEAPMMTHAKQSMIDAGTSDLDRAARIVIADAPGRLMVKEQLLVGIERYANEVVLNLSDNWRDAATYVFQRLTRRLEGDGLVAFPDGRRREVRAVGPMDGADPALHSEAAMLEEVLKNGPWSRVIPAGGQVLNFARRSRS